MSEHDHSTKNELCGCSIGDCTISFNFFLCYALDEVIDNLKFQATYTPYACAEQDPGVGPCWQFNVKVLLVKMSTLMSILYVHPNLI